MAGNSNGWRAVEWRRRLERFSRSGMTISGFCQSERVSVPSFYQWRKRLAASGVPRGKAAGRRPAFASVRLVGTSHVVVCLPGGTRVEIPLSDGGALKIALRTLAQVDARQAHADRLTQRGGAAY